MVSRDTITGLQVSDLDAAVSTETFTLKVTTGAAGSGTAILPATGSGLLPAINAELATGITYNPGPTPPSTDKVTLSIADGFGATDTVNFVFHGIRRHGAGDADGHVRQGRDFRHGQYRYTDGRRRRPVCFQQNDRHTHDHGLLDDQHIDLTALSSIVTSATLNTWLASNVVASIANPADTVISLGSTETITLHNVLAAKVHASDFMVHA